MARPLMLSWQIPSQHHCNILSFPSMFDVQLRLALDKAGLNSWISQEDYDLYVGFSYFSDTEIDRDPKHALLHNLVQQSKSGKNF
jgi:hypothetical protein